MNLFEASALLLTLAAVFNYLNHRYFKLPMTIGIMLMAFGASAVIALVGLVSPALSASVTDVLVQIDFNKTLMNGMLGLLLFAGALHVNLGDLTAQKGAVALLATAGVTASTFMVGGLMYLLLGLFDLSIPLIHCLLFGALISPTDPIAVLGILKTLGAPKELATKIAGESLFNDGVGVVIFLAMLGAAGLGHGDGQVTAAGVSWLFVQEAFGGALYGLVIGLITYKMLRSVDDYHVEILLSLALVIGGYALAQALHLSGPIAMVVAGLLIGNRGRTLAMSEKTRRNLDMFWELIDEILNAILFVLIGMTVLLLPRDGLLFGVALLTIPMCLLCRFIAVGVPISLLGMRRKFTPHAVKILAWGGLRGGISVALALWLSQLLGKEHTLSRNVILMSTYAVVFFSIVVQGLTIGPLLKRLGLIQGDGSDQPATE